MLCLEYQHQHPRTGNVLYIAIDPSPIVNTECKMASEASSGIWVSVIDWLQGVWVSATVDDKGLVL